MSLAKVGADVDVDIYESTASFGEIGAGIGMWPRVWETLKVLGLDDDLQRRASSLTGKRFNHSVMPYFHPNFDGLHR